jgi:hypothetical protein
MKQIIVLAFLISAFNSNAQNNSSTMDKALEATNSLLKLFDKKPQNQPKANETKSSIDSIKHDIIGIFIISNQTLKRVTLLIQGLDKLENIRKTYTLAIDDKEILKLQYGSYTYTVKFEDGTIAKNGEFELTNLQPTFEKTIK